MLLVLTLWDEVNPSLLVSVQNLSEKLSLPLKVEKIHDFSEINSKTNVTDVNFLFVDSPKFTTLQLMKFFKACRNLRMPYMIYKPEYGQLEFSNLLMPVHFLVEEKGKAQYASALSRFCGTKISLLQANDYGSRAANHTRQILDFLSKLNVEAEVIKASKDSFRVAREAVEMSYKGFDCLLFSASREYGLDDVIFGPPELYNTKISPVPIIWVNPRGDLFALCD